MRLGLYDCNILDGTKTKEIYKSSLISERHRHRYEVNNKFVNEFEKLGLVTSGTNPESDLVEIMEYIDHKFMIGVQFHPEFLSTPLNPHPLFVEFVRTAMNSDQSALDSNVVKNSKILD